MVSALCRGIQRHARWRLRRDDGGGRSGVLVDRYCMVIMANAKTRKLPMWLAGLGAPGGGGAEGRAYVKELREFCFGVGGETKGGLKQWLVWLVVVCWSGNKFCVCRCWCARTHTCTLVWVALCVRIEVVVQELGWRGRELHRWSLEGCRREWRDGPRG